MWPDGGRRGVGRLRSRDIAALWRRSAAILKIVRQWLPRPGWVRVLSACSQPWKQGTLRSPQEFYLVALLVVIAPDGKHGLDRVIVVLPVW